MPDELGPILDAVARVRAARGRAVVGVFGFAGSGKSVLARRLVDATPDSARLRGDDYLDPVRSHRRSSDWDGLDRRRLRVEALEPFRAGRPVLIRRLDWTTGELGEPTPLPRASVLVVDSVGLPHPDLDGCFDVSIWLDVDLDRARRQGMERDRAAGLDHDRRWIDVWSPNDRDFEQAFDPRERVDVLHSP